MSPITTHVLDLTTGRPAPGVALTLAIQSGETWDELARGLTDPDGRARSLLPDASPVAPGTYRLRFATGAYFQSRGVPTFYPWVDVHFVIDDVSSHYHVPLLLAPAGFSTYRGS